MLSSLATVTKQHPCGGPSTCVTFVALSAVHHFHFVSTPGQTNRNGLPQFFELDDDCDYL